MQIVSGPVGKEQIHYEAPPADRLEAEMRHFFHWWHESQGTTEGIIRAATAHFRFVVIHPFDDGNGRIARALTDIALAQNDRQPIRYYLISRRNYNETLPGSWMSKALRISRYALVTSVRK